MNTYYILLLDGSCHEILAKSTHDAVDKLAHLEYQDDLDSCWYDVNMIEWKGTNPTDIVQGEHLPEPCRYLQIYDRSMISETYRFHIDTDYRLAEYVTLTTTIQKTQ